MNLKELVTKDSQSREFRYVVVEFDRENEKDLAVSNEVYNQSKIISNQVNKSAANYAPHLRTNESIFGNCVAGLLAEKAWEYCINSYYQSNYVQATPYTGANGQIDLIITNSKKKIEVRSSFARNGVNFAISNPQHQFDILGPYTNMIKPNEVEKDYYLRTIYEGLPSEFFEQIFKPRIVKVNLTGGATWDMMWKSGYALQKSLKTEDSIQEEKSNYQVLPFKHALDTISMLKLI